MLKVVPKSAASGIDLLVMAGLNEKHIKQLVKQKDSDKETFFILCSALEEMDALTENPATTST